MKYCKVFVQLDSRDADVETQINTFFHSKEQVEIGNYVVEVDQLNIVSASSCISDDTVHTVTMILEDKEVKKDA